MAAILGNIIKSAVELRERFVGEHDHFKEQEDTFRELLTSARNTAFGKHYGFQEILDSDQPEKEFQKRVPFFDYSRMHDQWWHRIEENEKDVTWPGIPRYFARSSGTTGKTSKRIPVTDEMLTNIRKASIGQISAMANFDLPADFFEKEIMMLGSNTQLDKFGQFEEGEISGISASQIPFWFDGFYRPGKEISAIPEWDERVKVIAEKAPEWDIGALSGIPSWMELMMKAVIEMHGLKNIHEIWPNLQVYASGGVAFEPHRKSFEALLAHPVTVVDTYLASEGFLAFQTRPQTKSMSLATDHGVFFEFVPFKDEHIAEDGSIKDGSPALLLNEVEEGEEYALIISTVSGTWRYLIGDTITFTDKKKAEIEITGRTKHFLNVVGSQLSVQKMDQAILEIEGKFNLRIPEYTVGAVKRNGEYIHQWFLGIEDLQLQSVDNSAVRDFLDTSLQEANKNYAVARSKALKGVEVSLIESDKFYQFTESTRKKGGQVKFPRVMKEENLAEFQAFTETNKVGS